MNDLERLAAALREANAELDLQSPDLTATMDRAHRRLVGRLIAVATLSAVGAMLLLGGGLTASGAINPIRDSKGGGGDHGEKTTGGRPDTGDGRDGEGGNGGDGGGKNGNGRGEGKERKDEHRDKPKEKVEPGKEVGLPNLVVVSLEKDEVTVENRSPTNSPPFVVLVEATTIEGEAIEKPLDFGELLGEDQRSQPFPFELQCVSGPIRAEADYLREVDESAEGDNEREIECEPPEKDEKENEKDEREETTEGGSVD